jgi:hypothetical protein
MAFAAFKKVEGGTICWRYATARCAFLFNFHASFALLHALYDFCMTFYKQTESLFQRLGCFMVALSASFRAGTQKTIKAEMRTESNHRY